MSHIDEGELTAYADGAFAPDSADAQRIAAHVALCSNCRNLLEQARALSGRAAEILAVAAPINIATPDFADVRAAAATVRPRRNAIPLTWAATVILALGLGWFGRGATFEQMPQRTAVTTQPSTEMQPPADITAAAAEPTAATTELRQSIASRKVARSEPAAAPARSPTQEASATGQASNFAESSDVQMSTLEARNAAPMLSQAAAGAGEAEIEYMTSAEAERRGVQLHIVPELEVMRVGVRGGEVLVEQRLPDGKLIAITARSAPQVQADAFAKLAEAGQMKALSQRARVDDARGQQVAPAAPAIPSIEVSRGELRLRISAPLPPDSLRVLSTRIR